MKLCCVLMASGYSSRFGGNKLLADYRGMPVFARVCGAYPEGLFSSRIVVTQYQEVRDLAEKAGFRCVWNQMEDPSQAGTIRLGLAEAEKYSPDGCLFSVCDQPCLTAESVARMVKAFRESPDRIVALSWKGKRGNPVIFPRELFPELRGLESGGGSAVIKAYRERVMLVEAQDSRELADVDTAEQLEGLRK